MKKKSNSMEKGVSFLMEIVIIRKKKEQKIKFQNLLLEC